MLRHSLRGHVGRRDCGKGCRRAALSSLESSSGAGSVAEQSESAVRDRISERLDSVVRLALLPLWN